MNYQTNRPSTGQIEVIYTRTREYKRGDTIEARGMLFKLWSVVPERGQYKNTFVEVSPDEQVNGMLSVEE